MWRHHCGADGLEIEELPPIAIRRVGQFDWRVRIPFATRSLSRHSLSQSGNQQEGEEFTD
jgi:hypothetical protein